MKEFFLIMPEIFLALTLAMVIAGEITYSGEQIRLITATSLLGLGGAFVQTIISYQYGPSYIFGGVLSIDGFSLFFKLLFIALAGLSVSSVSQSQEISPPLRTEYCALILAGALAMCLMASASDLVLVFLSVLFLNVISYFLAAFGRRSILSTEAAVKFLAFGSVSLALLLYSFAVLFAHTHSLNIYEIHKSLVQSPLPSQVSLVIFLMSFLAFSFQVGAFPMFLPVPDILEGSPTPVSSFLSFGSRAAGFALMTRFLVAVFSRPGPLPGQWIAFENMQWTMAVEIVAALTMAVGALLAFRQKGAKRLVSYLVVAETGFLLIGLLVLDEVGIASLLYNLVIELFSLTGIFFILSFLFDELRTDRLEDLKGVLKRAVPESICLIVFLMCLVGIPPSPGFIGKFTLLGAAIRHHQIALALVGIFSMVLSTAAVARLSYHLIGDFRQSRGMTLGVSFPRRMFLIVLVVPLILSGVFAGFVFSWAGQSLGFIFQ